MPALRVVLDDRGFRKNQEEDAIGALACHPWVAGTADLGLPVLHLPDRVCRDDQRRDHLVVRAGGPLQSADRQMPAGWRTTNFCSGSGAGAGTVVMFIDVPVKEQYALQFYVGRPDGGERTIYVNPYTGAIQGEKSTFDLRQLLRELHGWLLIPFTAKYSPGWYIVSAMSIPLMGSLITGLFVYKKFWRAFLRPRLRIGAGRPGLLGRLSSACRAVVDPVHRHHERDRHVVPDRGVISDTGIQASRRDRASACRAPASQAGAHAPDHQPFRSTARSRSRAAASRG